MADNLRHFEPVFHKHRTVPGISESHVISDLSSTINIEFVATGEFTAVIEVQMIDNSKWYPWPAIVKSVTPKLAVSPISDPNYIYSVIQLELQLFELTFFL